MAEIHIMPDRLALMISADLKRQRLGHAEWVEASYDLCLHLAEARQAHPENIEFGQWCEANGFGETVINYDTRAAAITMGREPEAARVCLQETERRSLLQVFRFDFGRVRQISKTPKQPKPPRKEAPKTAAVREAIRETVAAGKPVNVEGWCDQMGVSSATVRFAEHLERGRLEGLHEQIDPLTLEEMRPTTAKRFAAAVKREVQARLGEERKTLYAEIELLLGRLKEREARAERIIASRRGVMTRAQYRRILACLHPDHNTFSHAAEALRIFGMFEDVLIKPDAPVQSGPPLPATVAELLARRRQHQR